MCEQYGLRFKCGNAPCQLPVDFALILPVAAKDIRVVELLSNTKRDQSREDERSMRCVSKDQLDDASDKNAAPDYHGDRKSVVTALQSEWQTCRERRKAAK